jgi:hypothetical protein
MSYVIRVGYDEAEHRYFVLSSDIPGLNIEASTFEEFVEIAQDLAADLVEDHTGNSKIRFEREVALTH